MRRFYWMSKTPYAIQFLFIYIHSMENTIHNYFAQNVYIQFGRKINSMELLHTVYRIVVLFLVLNYRFLSTFDRRVILMSMNDLLNVHCAVELLSLNLNQASHLMLKFRMNVNTLQHPNFVSRLIVVTKISFALIWFVVHRVKERERVTERKRHRRQKSTCCW